MQPSNKSTIQNFQKKCKLWWEAHENDLFLIAFAVLLSAIFLGAGRLWFAGFYKINSRKIFIEENAFLAPPSSVAIKNFVASINGEKYYPAGCKAADRIKQENRIWFSLSEEARDMGYTPSAQC